MKTKRILSALIAGTMVLGTMSFPVFAEGGTINGFSSFAEAVEHAQVVDNAVTYTISGEVEYSANRENPLNLAVEGATKVIITGDQTSKLTMTGHEYYGIEANGVDLEVNNITLADNRPDNGWEQMYIWAISNSVTYTDCTFEEGVITEGNSPLAVNNCIFNTASGKYAAWAKQGGNLTVKECTFNGPRAVKLGNDLSDFTATATVERNTFTALTEKPALAISNADTVTASGNTVTDSSTIKAMYLVEDDNITLNAEDAVAYVVNDEGCKEYYQTEDMAKTSAVADINGVLYTTVAAAINAAQDGDVVTILSERVDETLNIPALTNVTIEGAEDIKPMLKNVCEINASANNVTFSNIEFSQTQKTLKIQGKNITFKDCDFNARTLGYWDILSTEIYNGYSDITTLKNAENITFENCKFDGMGTNSELPNARLVASPNCKNLTIKNCSFTNAFSAFYYGYISGDWLVEDSVFDVFAYTTHTASDTVCESLTVKRTSFNGWTSYAGVKQALFEDCTFGGGTGNYFYPVLKAYSNTTLRNCTFSPDFNVEAAEDTYPKWIVDNCKRGDEILRRNEQFFSEAIDSENQEVEFIFATESTVIDTAKTTGAEIKLNNLDAHENIDINADATYKVVVSTAPVEDVAKANEAIIANTADTNESKAIFDISVKKVDSYGVETDLGGDRADSIKNQQVTLTLGETPVLNSTVYIYHVDNGSATKLAEVTADGTNKVTFTAPSFSTYAATYTAASLAEDEITKEIGVEFEPIAGTSSYNIVLKALDGKTINRFMSTDLTFDMTVKEGAVGYTITPAANINLIDNNNGRYEFNLDGVNQSGATGSEVTIGTVTFDGYGKIDFEVKTAATDDTNIVNTAKTIDNIVDSYTIVGDATTTGKLDLTNKLTDVTFTAPKKDLTINVTFPNNVNNNEKAYQDMKVTISGGDLAAPIVRELGSNNTDVTFASNTYTTEVSNELTKNTSYNVTVEGAGYRTARYTVRMTADKTLNFWNNVKDAEEFVEVGKADSAVKTNFLAGDIVKDNNINIYDLSAVVSYFGEIAPNTTNAWNNAKYDLNRDGKIDSKDVAYVLVSWGN